MKGAFNTHTTRGSEPKKDTTMSSPSLQHYIYKITCLETGEYYYGKRSAPDWKTDKYYMGSGKILRRKRKAHPNYTWIKEVLLLLDSVEEALEYERVVIGNKYYGGSDYDGLCLNLCEGGSGGGVCKADLIKREEKKRCLGLDEALDVSAFEMSNDELQQTIYLHNTENGRASARLLLESGWYLGAVTQYKHVNLRELGLIHPELKKNEACFLAGELPNLTSFFFSNHDLKQTVKLVPGKGTVTLAQKLLASGWFYGTFKGYKRVGKKALDKSLTNL